MRNDPGRRGVSEIKTKESIDNLYRIFLQHPVITTDSRSVPPQSIFFALKGSNFDGNLFADKALELGAACVVIEDPACRKDDRYLLVGNVLTALQELALYHRMKLEIPILGITGSNGKTTTKELIHAVLSKRYRTIATSGNLNNHIGVPLTLLSITTDTEIAAIEMGANHPGEIDFLCHLARPTHGLITNIGRAHLEGFGNFEGVVQTKTELYRFLKEVNGWVFINADDPLLMEHAEGLKRKTYGFSQGANLTGYQLPGQETLDLDITFPNHRTDSVHTRFFGSYNALNVMAAACIGNHFQVPAQTIVSAIEDYAPANNRSQVHRTQRNLLILDAYNANPDSMPAALKDFDAAFSANKMVILGDMLELGPETDREHQRILELLGELDMSKVFLVGPVFGRLNNNPVWRSFETSREAKEWFANHPVENAAILLKGSRGIRLEEIVESL
ncbi:MAG: UDP-N-acetylmuramoyl-tripeptide--D-alanyl-D-alanine ligase [bacterium]